MRNVTVTSTGGEGYVHKIGTQLRFEAAHQLEKGCFTTKCSDCIHGHSYLVELEISCVVLDNNKMVVDFGELKEWKKTVDDYYDHSLILPLSKQKFYGPLVERGELASNKTHFWHDNPTAEVIAFRLYGSLREWVLQRSPEGIARMNRNVCIERIRVWETANSYAEYRGNGFGS